MARESIRFDRGTLELGPDAPEIPRALWDPRTETRRAAAFHFHQLATAADAMNEKLDGDLRDRWMRQPRDVTGLELRPYQAQAMTVSGPLALFHDTVKYGHALARWFPALTAAAGWSLAARISLGGETLALELDASAPVPLVYSMPRAHDSKLEARLEVDLRRLDSDWRIEREVAVVRAPGRLLFPDFALVSGAGRVLVEVAGWWTPDSVAGKLELLRAVRVPLLLCIDSRHASTHSELLTDERVMLFEKRLDPRALVAACERILGGGVEPSAPT